jgi:hypothetical protein
MTRKRLDGEYYEVHHIIPRSIGGSNRKNNLTTLTAREHFICHLLLVKIYPNEISMVYASWLMANKGCMKDKREYRVSSRLYERLKKEWSLRISELNLGSKRSDAVRKKMSEIKSQQCIITRGSSGMKWFYNPITLENKLCFESDVPEGYVVGRYIKKAPQKGVYKWIYNTSTYERAQIKRDDPIPNGWGIGSGKGITKSIHNPNTMERKYIGINDEIPEGWSPGIGALNQEHKDKIGKSNKIALLNYHSKNKK